MSEATEITKKTLAQLRENKPVLTSVLDAFEPLLVARVATAEKLRADVRRLAVPSPDSQRFSDGRNLLAGTSLTPFWPLYQKAAKELLPVFAASRQMIPAYDAVADMLAQERDEDFQEQFLRALIHQEEETIAELCGTDDMQAASLSFMSEFALSSVLRALTANITADAGSDSDANPWPLWSQGHCPVCARLPIVDTLAKGVTDEKNPYLLAGGGKKHLHCGLCGADWLFRRAVCPACGAESKGVINVLIPTSTRYEHVAWCSECKTYTVGVDERSLSGHFDKDALALGLLHLDMIAAEKKLTPMCRTFWNQF